MAGRIVSICALAWMPGVSAVAGDVQISEVRARPRAGEFAFDIPAQPLQSALEQFMTVTAHSGLYDSQLLAGMTAAPVKGVMPPRSALEQLVARAGLQVRYPTADTFSLSPAIPGQPDSPPAGNADQAPGRASYFGALQSSLLQLLCAKVPLDPHAQRLALSVWVSSTGTVEKVRLLDTSGSAQRDARLVRQIAQLRLPPLPPGAAIRQPITLVIRPQPQDGGPACEE